MGFSPLLTRFPGWSAIQYLVPSDMIRYQTENDLDVSEFRDVLLRSTLGERRPINDPVRLKSMVEHGNLILTARDGKKLVGISRSLTDFQFCTYLSDLAVDTACQKQGIGRELIRQTKLASPNAKLILLSAPAAVDYYPRIGMKQFGYCFILDDVEELK